MKTREIILAVAVLLWIGGPVPATTSAETLVVSGPQGDNPISVTDVRVDNGVVSGVIVNTSHEVVRDVKLLIRNTWLWNNERRPGAASPSSAQFYTVRGEIPPGGSLPFTYRSSRLPARSDGRFDTAVDVAEFTQVGG